MAMKQPGRIVHRSANGKAVDMDMLRQRNELTPAVGNARVNARGDQLGAGGKIIRKKEDLLKDYYAAAEGMQEEQPVAKGQPTEAEAAEWEEDDDGNFVQKGN
jgi:hypothetical protein|tara:strand:- start:99 stop:407 length:309 start_codon:yes stop_codon:yes gene_type:complete